jgi:hypothetical protein
MHTYLTTLSHACNKNKCTHPHTVMHTKHPQMRATAKGWRTCGAPAGHTDAENGKPSEHTEKENNSQTVNNSLDSDPTEAACTQHVCVICGSNASGALKWKDCGMHTHIWACFVHASCWFSYSLCIKFLCIKFLCIKFLKCKKKGPYVCTRTFTMHAFCCMVWRTST